MLEVGFQHLGSGRDVSPDSVIFTAESNFSMFSSTSASVERCSFASEAPDPDSVATAVSQNLIGGGPDPTKSTPVNKISVALTRKEKSKDNSEVETTEDENTTTDSARSSFSRALKECQERRLRSEVVLKKTEHPRLPPMEAHNAASNAVSSTSPRFGFVQKPSTQKTVSFPSPGTPTYRHSSVVVPKGWSSERIPLHSNMHRRNLNGSLLSYNNGRTLPSKWEDAERWIFSPVSGEGSVRALYQQPQRRPKSKSGPLGPPGLAYHQMFSPAVPVFERGIGGKMTAGDSPISAGVASADAFSRHRINQDGNNSISATKPCMARSISIHGYGEMLGGQSALHGQEDGKRHAVEDAAADNMYGSASRRDMATQMSPESSTNSSSGRISSFSIAAPPIVALQSMHSSRQEIRDMPIDEHVTMSRWSKKSWIISAGASKSISRAQKEEAKIAAWENLQKAKAEAAIRKLEMKLEKKRSSSMEKILSKLRAAQNKAETMRSSVMANQTARQANKTSERMLSPPRRRRAGYFSRIFTCRAC